MRGNVVDRGGGGCMVALEVSSTVCGMSERREGSDAVYLTTAADVYKSEWWLYGGTKGWQPRMAPCAAAGRR